MGKQKIIGFVLWGVAALVIVVEQEDLSEVLPPAILFIVVGLILIVKKTKTKEDKQRIKDNIDQQNRYNKLHMTAKHQAGLPLATGAECAVGYEDDGFSFNGSGNNFSLSFNKITDICLKTDSEIQKQYVSSVGGAVAGAVVFGPLGAIVGGRAKKKTTTTVTNYLIFTYLKEESIDYISFELNYGYNMAKDWINKFNEEQKTTQGKTVIL